MSARGHKRGINGMWQFLRGRYRHNLDHPPQRTLQQRVNKASTGVVVGLFLGVGGLLIATVGGQVSGWFTAAVAGGLIVSNVRVIRKARRDHSQHDSLTDT